MTAGPVSPLAPAETPTPPPIAGVRAAVGRAGFYKRDRDDLVLVALDPGTQAAGVYTVHSVGSAPVDWCQAVMPSGAGPGRALLVNAGCANAFTGAVGAAAAESSARAVATALGASAQEVLLASTGVIGVPLDAAKITAQLPHMVESLAVPDWPALARAIMTTDTFPKAAGAAARIGDAPVALAGIAKGSGMIAPNMATMLAFAFTDARLPAPLLRELLADAVADSFNAITVDGDRSTNDCVILFATGAAGPHPTDGAALDGFRASLNGLLEDLAVQIVRDGEGATKLVTIYVDGAASDAAAKAVARSIAESPLVKTAIAGEDANWGRIVMAVGKTDETVNRDRISIRFGPHAAARDGAVAADYNEDALSAYMRGDELDISVTIGDGPGRARMRTCDLTKRYIEINGDYRS